VPNVGLRGAFFVFPPFCCFFEEKTGELTASTCRTQTKSHDDALQFIRLDLSLPTTRVGGRAAGAVGERIRGGGGGAVHWGGAWKIQ
jgi:hypothetical protein